MSDQSVARTAKTAFPRSCRPRGVPTPSPCRITSPRLKAPEAQAPVYANRRRIRGARGRRLMRQRGEKIERSFAHVYDTGGMRRTHLRGHTNILKRLLIHSGAFNLGLVMRKGLGVGTPRGLQDRGNAVVAALFALWSLVTHVWTTTGSCPSGSSPSFTPSHRHELLPACA